MSEAQFKFTIGQIVHHRRYGYRGVIFARDPACEADEVWYQSNQTQPNRKQPWYHVLVDGAVHTTYVAESNLEPDPNHADVTHPWLSRYFATRVDDRYYPVNLN